MYKLKRAKSKRIQLVRRIDFAWIVYVPLVTRSLIVNCLTIVLHQQSAIHAHFCADRCTRLPSVCVCMRGVERASDRKRMRSNSLSRIPLSLIEWKPGKRNYGNSNRIDISNNRTKMKAPEQHVYSERRLTCNLCKILFINEENYSIYEQYIHNILQCVYMSVWFCELNCMNVHAMRKWWLKMIQWIACYFRNNYQLVVREQKYFKLLNNFLHYLKLYSLTVRLTRQIRA